MQDRLVTKAIGGLDKPAIEELWAGDEDTFAKIAEIFLEEVEWRLASLDGATVTELEHHAHSLKGAAANVGATHLSALSAQLEEVAMSKPSSDPSTLIAQIKEESVQTRKELLRSYIVAYPNA